jgi:NAD(P)-dependent dehydrogenase (short-subunit alcohol dehydrogenase family)
MKGLRDKVAVVTGGSCGIGQQIETRLAEEGVDVAINFDGRPEGAKETREMIDHDVRVADLIAGRLVAHAPAANGWHARVSCPS